MVNISNISLKKFFFFLLLFISIQSFSQKEDQPGITDITKITFLNPGLSYEKAIGGFSSLYAQAYINLSFGLGYSSSLGGTSFFYADPAATLQYRYYYNFKKREKKGRRTNMNNLNYICAISQLNFTKGRIEESDYTEEDLRAITTLGAAWGMQRNYPKRFSLDLSLGLGYFFGKATRDDGMGGIITPTVGKLTTVGQFTLGFWLNKRH